MPVTSVFAAWARLSTAYDRFDSIKWSLVPRGGRPTRSCAGMVELRCQSRIDQIRDRHAPAGWLPSLLADLSSTFAPCQARLPQLKGPRIAMSLRRTARNGAATRSSQLNSTTLCERCESDCLTLLKESTSIQTSTIRFTTIVLEMQCSHQQRQRSRGRSAQ